MKTRFFSGDGKEIFGEKLCCEAGLLRCLREQCLPHPKVLSLNPFCKSQWTQSPAQSAHSSNGQAGWRAPTGEEV